MNITAMNTTTANMNRVPAGVVDGSGGQFATTRLPESGQRLAGPSRTEAFTVFNAGATLQGPFEAAGDTITLGGHNITFTGHGRLNWGTGTADLTIADAYGTEHEAELVTDGGGVRLESIEASHDAEAEVADEIENYTFDDTSIHPQHLAATLANPDNGADPVFRDFIAAQCPTVAGAGVHARALRTSHPQATTMVAQLDGEKLVVNLYDGDQQVAHLPDSGLDPEYAAGFDELSGFEITGTDADDRYLDENITAYDLRAMAGEPA